MTWLKIDDQFPDHPKVVSAGPLASWVHVCGMAYCARFLTDGFIPAGKARTLADVESIETLIERLVDVGLWHAVEGGYEVHDFLKYNPASGKVQQTREELHVVRSEAGRKGGLISGMVRAGIPIKEANEANGQAKSKQSAEQTGKQNRSPVPVPVPVPDSDDVAITRVPRARESDDVVSVDVHPVYGLMDDTDTPEDKAFRAVAGIVETAGNTYAEHGLLDGLREYSDEPDPVAQAKSWLTKYGGQYDRPGKRVSSYLEWLKVARRDRLEGPAYRSPPNGHSPPRHSALPPELTAEEIADAEVRFGRSNGHRPTNPN